MVCGSCINPSIEICHGWRLLKIQLTSPDISGKKKYYLIMRFVLINRWVWLVAAVVFNAIAIPTAKHFTVCMDALLDRHWAVLVPVFVMLATLAVAVDTLASTVHISKTVQVVYCYYALAVVEAYQSKHHFGFCFTWLCAVFVAIWRFATV